MIQEEDFQRMAASGITVVRVPCGYWNWITYPDGATPNGSHSKEMRLLQSIPPATYRKYFDRIFTSARKYGLRVLLDLHGLPGSQNGEMHSGLTVGTPHFDTDWNKYKAVEAVTAMAKYASEGSRLETLYGLQIINEPNHYQYDIHDFLDRYYDEAIIAARRFLPAQVPIIVFEWTYNFENWSDDRFSYDQYGTVMWVRYVTLCIVFAKRILNYNCQVLFLCNSEEGGS